MKKRNIVLAVFLSIIALLVLSRSFRSFFTDSFVFLKSFFVNPTSVGAVIPSSQFLASAITKYVKRTDAPIPIKVLEVGAGTGSMSSNIAEKLRDDDVLDIVELDPNFCKILENKFSSKDNININCLSILDWNPSYSYDFIVSGLPFNAFDSDFVKSILNKYKKLIKPGGIISYFEYIALAKIKLFFLKGDEKQQFSKTITTTTQFRNKFEFDNEKVFANMPPARVYHLRVE
ncbi:methyltransferase [Candidatus Dependentiae bacterium]|nr:methyltransferase [Candidatus Dependentiae bacterium]